MGLWGSFVVARTPGSLLDLAAVVDRSEGLSQEDRHGDWVVGLFPGNELAGQEPELHEELAAETSAPALTAFVLDSDAAIVEAWSSSDGFWRACLDRASAQKYVSDPAVFGSMFLSGEGAARHAARWAREGGLAPDEPALLHLFTQAEADPFVEGLVQALLEHLGIPPKALEPMAPEPMAPEPMAPEPMAPEPMALEPMAPEPMALEPMAPEPMPGPGRPEQSRDSNPLDVLVARHVTPLLAAAGFARKGREYCRSNANGDELQLFVDRALTWVDGKVTCIIGGRLTPAALTDWRCDHPTDLGEVFPRVRIDVHPPLELAVDPSERLHTSSSAWAVDLQDAASVAALEHFLREVLIPRTQALLDPRIAADLVSDQRYEGPSERSPERFAFLLDLGPSAALARDWAALTESAPWLGPKVLAWAEDRLRTRFGVGPQWREYLDPGDIPGDAPGTPAARLAALAQRYLSPVLAAAGLEFEGGVFRRTNDLGDQLVVQPVLAHCAGGDDLVFSIDASVMPAMELRRRRDDRGADPLPPVSDAASGWCWRRIVPAPAFTHEPTHVAASLELWHALPEDDEACGAAVADAVREALPELSRLLDRDRLLALVTDPEGPSDMVLGVGRRNRGEIVLRLDRSPAERVVALIDHLEADFFGRGEAGFIAWARAVLTRADR